jgi:valine--pyruvate aminotransferase
MSSLVPSLPFSLVGQKLTGRSGILALMDDLGKALTLDPQMRMLGGGNPAAVPEMQACIRERMAELLAEGAAFDRMIGNYDPPQGNPPFCAALAKLLRETFGWEIGPENVAITTGGQTAFFYLFNLLGGRHADGLFRKILLPLCPEYIGYADQGLDESLFVACQPRITWPEGEASRVFKYTVDFEAVSQALAKGNIAAIAVSRPTNPTGNVLTDAEVARLSQLATSAGIPLILDNAYGAPFPGVIFTDATPFWSPGTILTLSLSKLGLPGTRTAIVIGPPEIASAMGAMTAIAGLANGNIGQQLARPWVESGEILKFGPRWLCPFYRRKSDQALGWMRESCDRAGIDWAVHASEGAFFHWLWLRDLAIPTLELYERLKRLKVLVVPGEYFFFGLDPQDDAWPHRRQCLRLNFAQPEQVVREGLEIIAQEAARSRG